MKPTTDLTRRAFFSTTTATTAALAGGSLLPLSTQAAGKRKPDTGETFPGDF